LDQVLIYVFDSARGSLTPGTPPYTATASGAGPRHLTFGPNERFAYVLNELNATVATFDYDKRRGTLKQIDAISALPKDFSGVKSGAGIAVHPSGKFLYTSNRGHDSLALFNVDGKKGTLNPRIWIPTQGRTPRHFSIDPTGRYLFAANQDSNNVVLFRIDQKTGEPAAAGSTLDVPLPVCVVFAAVR
jgi:6-phosphogluconolactonase